LWDAEHLPERLWMQRSPGGQRLLNQVIGQRSAPAQVGTEAHRELVECSRNRVYGLFIGVEVPIYRPIIYADAD
jgi:hypothetical protein